MQNKNKMSLLNAATAMAMTLVNGLFGIVVTWFIIAKFGDDFNGLNSTANQIVNLLLILEGGFTVASNVALFGPLGRQETDVVNGILCATRKKFRRIGLIFLAIGIAVAAVYSFTVNSNLPWDFIFTLIVMTVVPAAFNLYYATTYRVLLQTQQKEYIVNLITVITVSLGHIANIVMIRLNGPMWMVRFNTMVFTLLASLLTAGYVKKKNPSLDFGATPRPDLIAGTGDVMAQKITGMIYKSAPIVFLSLSPSGGTALASVYAVYNNIFLMLKNLLHSIIDAPRHSLGQLLTERDREDVWPVFAAYEYVAFLAIFVMLTTCCTLILPFIGLYTYGFTDSVNYYDLGIALLMVITAAVEMLHIPSGHLLNMAGCFRISRNFQIISCVVLVISMAVGGIFWGVYGMLAAVLLCSVLLATLETGYVHTRFFSKKLPKLLLQLLPMVAAGVLLCYCEMQLTIQIRSYFQFVLYGILFVAVNGLAAAVISLIFNRSVFLSLLRRVKSLLRK